MTKSKKYPKIDLPALHDRILLAYTKFRYWSKIDGMKFRTNLGRRIVLADLKWTSFENRSCRLSFSNLTKVRSEIKETTCWDGHVRTLSGHSVANYNSTFYKTEVPMVILRCLLSLNHNWSKSYDINSNVFW